MSFNYSNQVEYISNNLTDALDTLREFINYADHRNDYKLSKALIDIKKQIEKSKKDLGNLGV